VPSQVKANVAQKDEDLELLRDAVQTEKVKISRLEKLIKSNNAASGSGVSVASGSTTGGGGGSVRKRDAFT